MLLSSGIVVEAFKYTSNKIYLFRLWITYFENRFTNYVGYFTQKK